MTFHLDDEALKLLVSVLDTPAVKELVAKEEQESYARGLRGDVTANWLDKVVDRMYSGTVNDGAPQHLVNEATGQNHTVESMVEQYKDMVGLDTLTKSASGEILLSKKQIIAASEHGIADLDDQKKKSNELAEEEEATLLNNMYQEIQDHLGSHRGYADSQAIIWNLRSLFGDDAVLRFREQLDEKIEEAKSQYDYSNPLDSLPYAPKGQPLKVDMSPSEDDNMFRNIRDRGAR